MHSALFLTIASMVLIVLNSCQTPVSETEMRVFRPSILRAHVVDAEGHRIETYDTGTKPAPVVRVFASGFTPVRQVVLQTVDGSRQFSMERRGDKTFELPLDEVLAEIPARSSGNDASRRLLEFRIVAVDIEGDETSTDPFRVTINDSAH